MRPSQIPVSDLEACTNTCSSAVSFPIDSVVFVSHARSAFGRYRRIDFRFAEIMLQTRYFRERCLVPKLVLCRRLKLPSSPCSRARTMSPRLLTMPEISPTSIVRQLSRLRRYGERSNKPQKVTDRVVSVRRCRRPSNSCEWIAKTMRS